ncbi:MAG: hypothetical protein JXQ90_20980 [Cyclobacteriaceae bacterium]
MSEFDEYLIGKKINPTSFKKNESDQYESFARIFDQMHPDSFTAQKLFLINNIRLRNPYEEESVIDQKVKPKVKPKIAPRIKK